MAERQVQKQHEDAKQADAQKESQQIRVTYGQFGQKAQSFDIKKGMTFGEFKTSQKVQAREVRLNRALASDDTELKEGDMIIAVPQAIQGGW